MYYVYMLRCDDNSLYTGITSDIEKRLNEHINKLKTAASYTKSHSVVSIEALWSTIDRSSASQLEHKIKKLPKEKKEALIYSQKTIEDYERLFICNRLKDMFK